MTFSTFLSLALLVVAALPAFVWALRWLHRTLINALVRVVDDIDTLDTVKELVVLLTAIASPLMMLFGYSSDDKFVSAIAVGWLVFCATAVVAIRGRIRKLKSRAVSSAGKRARSAKRRGKGYR